MRARFRPVTMQLAKGFPSQQSRPGDTSNEPRHSPRRPWPTRRVAPAWPNWSGVKGVGPTANNTRSTGSSLYLGCKFGHGHEHVLGRGHGHGQYRCSLHLFARPAVRPLQGKLRLLDQLIRFPVDLDRVMEGLEGVGKTRVGP